MKLVRDYFGGHGLSCPWMTGEERIEPFAQRQLSIKTPLGVNNSLILIPSANFSELGQLIGREHNIVPFVFGFNLVRKLRQVMTQARAGRGKQIAGSWLSALLRKRLGRRLAG